MRKFFTFLATMLLVVSNWSCEYDDDNLWNAVDDLNNRVEAMEKAVEGANNNIAALQKLVDALQKNVTVESVEKTANGYTIKFSDGTTATITNGKDGQNGQDGQDGKDGINAPAISVVKGEDGCYYWALDGKIIEVDGHKIKAEGQDGVTPLLRINSTTKEWEMSTDGGLTWEPMGVKAEGQSGDSLFASVDVTTKPGFAIFTLADGTVIELPMKVEMQITMPEYDSFLYNETKEYKLSITGVEKMTWTKPDGWKVVISNNMMSVTSPAQDNPFADAAGSITIIGLTGDSACMAEMRVEVKTGNSHSFTVTFEGQNWEKWVVANYKPNTYSTTGIGSPDDYVWVDADTQLTTGRPTGFMNGWGYPWFVCSYNSNSLDQSKYGGYTYDLYVYNPNGVEDSTKGGGAQGSDNFLTTYGYLDLEHPYGDGRPILKFADGMARTITSLYIAPTCYFYSVACNGNSLSPAVEKDIIFHATGVAEDGQEKTLTMVFGSKSGIIKEWTKWDLSELGPIVELRLNQSGGADNGYGYSLPAYYAIDDITIEW